MNLDSIAYCGLYCDACSFKRAHDDQDLDHMRAMPDRYAPYKDHLPDACPGCRLENQCGPCPIRDCARERALLHCGQCPGLPCERLVRFTQDGVPHHAQAISNLDSLRTLGEAAWLDHQARQWTCSCGSRQSWYRPQCRNHAPAPVPPKTGVFLLTEASEARQAAELAATGHAAMWTSLPFLPVRSPAHFLPKMTWMIREGWVIGQFQDGVLEAFLGGCLIEDFRNLGRGAFCPDWCHGAAPGVMAFDAFRALYRELASLWKDQEILIHAAAVHATEDAALDAFALTGFGRIVLDAARPTSELLEELEEQPATKLIRRADLPDAEALAALDAELAAHIGASPVLMPRTRGRDAHAWRTWLQEPGAVAYLALDGARVVGFIKAQPPQCDVTDAVHAPGTLAINGMYVVPSRRRQGIARHLLLRLAREAALDQMPLMSVDCETLNPEAYGFWIRHFRPVTWSLERRI